MPHFKKISYYVDFFKCDEPYSILCLKDYRLKNQLKYWIEFFIQYFKYYVCYLLCASWNLFTYIDQVSLSLLINKNNCNFKSKSIYKTNKIDPETTGLAVLYYYNSNYESYSLAIILYLTAYSYMIYLYTIYRLLS